MIIQLKQVPDRELLIVHAQLKVGQVGELLVAYWLISLRGACNNFLFSIAFYVVYIKKLTTINFSTHWLHILVSARLHEDDKYKTSQITPYVDNNHCLFALPPFFFLLLLFFLLAFVSRNKRGKKKSKVEKKKKKTCLLYTSRCV